MDWELAFMAWGKGWWSSSILDAVLPWLTHFGSQVAVILFLLLSWFLTRKTKILSRLLLLYAIETAVVYGLKFLIQRERPLPDGASAAFFRGPGEIIDPSFPSAHALYAFMMATLLSAWFPRYRILFYVLAGFVGWTRIYLWVHYPTDVIVGGLLGYGITRLFLTKVGIEIQTKGQPSGRKK